MRIDIVEIDEGNVTHLTSHGVSTDEVRTLLLSRPVFRRNPKGRAGNFDAIANGVRVNFWYEVGVARPVSAWRVR